MLKIDILSLHMGYGGIETSLVSQANVLSKNHKVRIISLYKQPVMPHKINKEVEIIYLMNKSSNRKELTVAFREKNIKEIIKQIINSIDILIRKNYLIKKHLINSDAQVIVSTRYDFTKKLNYYGSSESKKIGEEHTYNIDKKYLKKYNKLKNIDKLVVVSKSMESEYKKKINNIDIRYIPNIIDHFPDSKSITKSINKNLIAIGRLEPEKGFLDLIETFNMLNKIDNSYQLNIFGDGSQKEILESKIKEYRLKTKVTLHGFQKKDVLNNYLKTSSLYVMTSFEESFGIVLIEAMSFGVPCIIFDDAKGALEIVNKKNGFIIENRDKKMMVDTILKYFQDENKENYISETRATASKYKKEVVKKEWLKLIGEFDEKDIQSNI